MLTPKLNKYIPHKPTNKQSVFLLLNGVLDVFYGGAAGGGKALPLDAEIVTPMGMVPLSDLKVGDYITDPGSGKNQQVTVLHPIENQDEYLVTFQDGTVISCSGNHLWRVCHNRGTKQVKGTGDLRGKREEKLRAGRASFSGSAKIMSTVQIQAEMRDIARHLSYNISVPMPMPTEFYLYSKDHEYEVDPFVFGTFLSTGTIENDSVNMWVSDVTSYQHIEKWCEANEIGFMGEQTENGVLLVTCDQALVKRIEKFWPDGYEGEQIVPESISMGRVARRKEFLSALVRFAGHVDNRGYGYLRVQQGKFVDELIWIARSLGMLSYADKPTEEGTQSIRFMANQKSFFDDSFINDKRKHSIWKQIVKVEKTGQFLPMRCITVGGPDGLYLTKDFTITHNSDALLMAALQYVEQPEYNALIMRASYQDLALPGAIMDRAKEWLIGTDAKWNDHTKTFTFPSGATLVFGYLSGPNDHYRYKGSELQFVGIDECSDLRWDQQRYLFSRIRRSANSDVPLRYRCASNPGGMSHEALYKHYIDPTTRPKGVVFVPAGLGDNPHLNQAEYTKSLMELDVVERAQLLDGNWMIMEQGTLFQRPWFKVVQEGPPATSKIVKRLRWWDLAATDDPLVVKKAGKKNNPDYTVGALLALDENGITYVEDIVRGRWGPLDVERCVLQTAQMDSVKIPVYIEQEPGSAGKALIDYYQRRVLLGFSCIGQRSTGPKEEYAKPFSAAAEQDRIRLVKADWNRPLIDEFCLFPHGQHDDIVDAVTKAYSVLCLRPKVGAWGRNRRNRIRILR